MKFEYVSFPGLGNSACLYSSIAHPVMVSYGSVDLGWICGGVCLPLVSQHVCICL